MDCGMILYEPGLAATGQPVPAMPPHVRYQMLTQLGTGWLSQACRDALAFRNPHTGRSRTMDAALHTAPPKDPP